MVSDIVTIDLDYKFLPNEKQAEVRKEFEEFVYNFSQTDPWLKENPIQLQWELGGLYFPPIGFIGNSLSKNLIIGGIIYLAIFCPAHRLGRLYGR